MRDAGVFFACILTYARARNVTTFTWWHPQNCGDHFAMTLLRYGCPGLPDDASLPAAYTAADGVPVRTKVVSDFKARYYESCRGVALDDNRARIGVERRSRDGGEQLEWSWQQRKGNFIVLLRDPRQRLLSHLAALTRQRLKRRRPPTSNLARMTAERTVFARGLTADMEKADDQARRWTAAVDRLETGFAFVGIAERWSQSVCLFHSLFGGDCLPSEMTPQTTHTPDALGYLNSNGWNISVDDPWWQPANFPDVAVYAAAVRWFERRRVSDEACAAEICPRARASFAGLGAPI